VQRDLQGSGYELLTAAGLREAAEQLARRAPRLILVTGLTHRIGDASPTQPAGEQEDIYALCRAIKAAAQPAGPTVLLLASVWAEDVLARGLDAGADYFIFAPYQPQDLLRSIRNVLLNGPSKEATEAGEQGLRR
jgi:DNA-binding response OmpR family regulator